MISNYDVEVRRKAKMRSDDRILVLQPKRGMTAKDCVGRTDPRVFTGENNLHIIYDNITGMWKLKYDFGGLPETLKQCFTTFGTALSAVKKYFDNRNVEVVKVID